MESSTQPEKVRVPFAGEGGSRCAPRFRPSPGTSDSVSSASPACFNSYPVQAGPPRRGTTDDFPPVGAQPVEARVRRLRRRFKLPGDRAPAHQSLRGAVFISGASLLGFQIRASVSPRRWERGLCVAVSTPATRSEGVWAARPHSGAGSMPNAKSRRFTVLRSRTSTPTASAVPSARS